MGLLLRSILNNITGRTEWLRDLRHLSSGMLTTISITDGVVGTVAGAAPTPGRTTRLALHRFGPGGGAIFFGYRSSNLTRAPDQLSRRHASACVECGETTLEPWSGLQMRSLRARQQCAGLFARPAR